MNKELMEALDVLEKEITNAILPILGENNIEKH